MNISPPQCLIGSGSVRSLRFAAQVGYRALGFFGEVHLPLREITDVGIEALAERIAQGRENVAVRWFGRDSRRHRPSGVRRNASAEKRCRL